MDSRAYCSSEGIALMSAGRAMAPHNIANMVAPFASMLESDSPELLELVTSEAANAAMAWLQQPAKADSSAELEI